MRKTANNRIRLPLPQKIFNVFNILFLLIIIVITLYPFWHALMVSVSSPSRYMKHNGAMLVPLDIDFASYSAVFTNPNMGYGFFNSFVNVAVGVVVGLLLTIMAAYALTRKNFYFKRPLMFFMVLTMFISGGLIPMYLTIDSLNLINTRWAVILPMLINTYNVVVTRVFFSSIPDSLEESARLDGANDLVILFKIFVPISMPIIAVVTLFIAVDRWNAWFYPMIFLNKRSLFPVSLILREILIANDTSAMTANVSVGDKEPIAETIKYATMIVSILPVVVIYPFLQKYFIQGMMLGAVKE